MDLSQLRTFVHTAELGSLSKAAGRLRIAQPALSRQIRLLEEELGVRLFDRHGRGMVLTEHGRAILGRASRILGELDELKTSVGGAEGELSGHVAVGLSPTIADVVAVPLIAAFRARHPKVVVRLVSAYSGYLLEWLHRGEVELAILYDPRSTRALRSFPLMRESLFLIGAPDAGLSRDEPVPFRDVIREPLLLPSTRQDLRTILETYALEAGVTLDVTVETDSYSALKDLVRNGFGRTILPLAPIFEDVSAGRLSAAPLVDPAPTRQLTLAFPSDRPVSRAAEFAGDALRSIMADYIKRGFGHGLDPTTSVAS
jgi:LysR family transcriptional regulator, nitrogen assimilation regulatory protein